MKRPTDRATRLAGWIALPVAALLSASVVGIASYSAFSATTVNPTNNWTAGALQLTDDDTSTAMFNATGLAPGATGERCIVVTSNSTLASTVKLYGTTPATTNALSSSINLVVTAGTGGSFAGSCTGFTPLGTGSGVFTGTLASFGTTATNYATGLGSWVPGTGTQSRTYRFVYTLDAAAPNTTQGGTASIGFTWEAQSN